MAEHESRQDLCSRLSLELSTFVNRELVRNFEPLILLNAAVVSISMILDLLPPDAAPYLHNFKTAIQAYIRDSKIRIVSVGDAVKSTVVH